jgi:hypothetical protein
MLAPTPPSRRDTSVLLHRLPRSSPNFVFWNDADADDGEALNVIQGVCRDFHAGALLPLERTGYTPVLSVHDKIIAETPEGLGSVEKFLRLRMELPKWTFGFRRRRIGSAI